MINAMNKVFFIDQEPLMWRYLIVSVGLISMLVKKTLLTYSVHIAII